MKVYMWCCAVILCAIAAYALLHFLITGRLGDLLAIFIASIAAIGASQMAKDCRP